MRLPRSVLGRLGLMAVLWSALIAVFWSLTTATDLVPDDRIAQTLVGAAATRAWQPEGSVTEMGLQADHFTDCVAFTQGLGEVVPPVSRVQQSMADVQLAPEGCAGVVEKLAALLSGQVVEGSPHFRYWHGYVLLSRPVLAWADVTTLRISLALLLGASLAALLVGLVRSVGPWAAGAFGLPLVLTSDLVALPMSTVHCIAWTVLLLGGAAAVWSVRKWGTWGAATCALLAGSAYVFVDLLTNPPAAVMVLLAGVLAGSAGSGVGPVRSARTAAIAGFVWGIGYTATWISKWLISATVFGIDAVYSQIQSMIAFRISGDYGTVEKRFGAATQANWDTWMHLDTLVTLAVVVCLLVTGVAFGLTIRRRPACLGWMAAFSAVSLVPFAWYEIVSNHSQIHAWFTFRSLPASLGVLMLGVAVTLRCRQMHEDPRPSTDHDDSDDRPPIHAGAGAVRQGSLPGP
ncbi:MAG: hypothetical protein R2720_02790 [Candidatus Nanopelagicales bacterium]